MATPRPPFSAAAAARTRRHCRYRLPARDLLPKPYLVVLKIVRGPSQSGEPRPPRHPLREVSRAEVNLRRFGKSERFYLAVATLEHFTSIAHNEA